ncbi:MAG: hypothetical protein AB8F94_21905 [Saprospiraceae bacterium]
MGVDLNVWSNHKLRFNSFEEGIEQIERQSFQKIKQWNFKADRPLIKTSNISEVEYFTHFEILQHNFENWNQIRIWTNFEFCDELTFLKKTVKIHPTKFRTRYSKWLEVVTEKYETEDETELTKMKLSRKNWMEFRKYAKEITTTLKGEKVIYLNDHSYQKEEDLFHEGKSLEEGIKKLKEIVEPCELELLELFPDNIQARNTWYFDEV